MFDRLRFYGSGYAMYAKYIVMDYLTASFLRAPRKIRIFHRVQLDPKKDPLQTDGSCRASHETYH